MRNIISVSSLLIILFISISFSIPIQLVEGSTFSQNNIDDQEPQFICKKNEIVELKYTPVGDLTSKIAKVWLEVYNNGSQTSTVDVIDRIDSISTSTLSMLYGTPNPTELENLGNLTLLMWNDVTINTDSRIEYQYLADSFKEIPVTIDGTMLINGEPANITKAKEIYMVNANVSDIITFQIIVKNAAQQLYTDKGKVTPPLPCIISATLSDDYFSNLKADPETNSTSIMAGKSVMTWYVFLEESPATFSISGKISKVSSWGEVPIDPISVQIASDLTVLEQQLERGIDGLDASIEMLEDFMDAMYSFSDAFSGIGSAVGQIASAIGKVEEVDSSLVNALKALAQSINANCILLNQSKNNLQLANELLTEFMSDSDVMDLLSIRPDLEAYLEGTITNINTAYAILDQVINGDENLPGLYQIYGMTLQISEALSSTNVALDQIEEGMNKLADGLSSASSSIRKSGKEMKEPLMDLEDEKEDMEDLILILRYKKMKPYDLEIRNSEDSNNTPIDFDTRSIHGQIIKAEITNSESYDQIVHGLSIQLKSGDELIQPSVEVLMSPHNKGIQYPAKWRAFDLTELNQIGLEYDSKSSTLYLWPMRRVNVSNSENVLVDWLGRPIRIIFESDTEPEVLYKADIANLLDQVQIDSTEGQSIFSITQPHILVQNITWGEIPPPLPPPKSWIQIVVESLQKPEIQLFIIISIAVIILLTGAFLMRGRERRRAAEERETLLTKKIVTADLLKEISNMEKILQDEEDFKDQ
ncbi:MAG: hypothetical protein L6M37_01405 [Candidatus Methylarchaceae archaeon HK02M1]|nr:hypothetical protein [Candidatus Methylarchaceae archaeon HK02M1]